jgi:hypothetical protein
MRKFVARVEAFVVAKPKAATVALLVTSAGWAISGPIALFSMLLK